MKFSISNLPILLRYLLGLFGFVMAMSLLILVTEPVNVTPDNREIKIPSGATLSQIAKQLREKKIISSEQSFILLAKLKQSQTQLKSGFYDIRHVKSANQLINLLKQGQNLSTRITIPEGTTINGIAKIISQHINIDEEKFVALTQDSLFLAELGMTIQSLEGYLFPDTYFFYKNDDEKTIIKKMVSNFRQKWQQIQEDIPINGGKSQHELLTLASLIEGECMIDRERPIVSSLYQNRLKRQMKLEADPTIQYIIDDAPRRLLNKDLKIQSPYNTYQNRGLPPGPVNNPGVKSILAAINPAETNFLYMVATGDGSHFFTRHYWKFLQAKRKFQAVRRKYKE